jgi:hypothetical protein
MRKKKHFKIASKNRQYDRFYVINYLEPGKNWESFENDNYESDDEKRDEYVFFFFLISITLDTLTNPNK